MNKKTILEARKEAHQMIMSGVDLKGGETKRDWIESYIEKLKEDGVITRKFRRLEDGKIFTLEEMEDYFNKRIRRYKKISFEKWLEERLNSYLPSPKRKAWIEIEEVLDIDKSNARKELGLE